MSDKKNKHSTHYIHRISYTSQERMVGVFVLSAVAVMMFLLLASIKSQNLFEDYLVFYGKVDTANGLSTETIVQISGIEVGKVAAIEITDDNYIKLTMHIFDRFHKLLRTDSKVKVSGLNATIIGKSVIEITAGSHDKALLKTGATLDIQETNSIDDVIAEAKSMLNVIKAMIYDVSKIVSSVDPEKIASMVASFDQMATNIELYSQRMNSAKGTLGSLVNDKKMKENMNQSIENMRAMTEDMKILAKRLKGDVKDVPVVLEKIQTVIGETQAVIGETQKTIKATQSIWPISSGISKKKPNNTVSPLPAND